MIDVIVAFVVWLDDRAYLRRRRVERAERCAEIDAKLARLAEMG